MAKFSVGTTPVAVAHQGRARPIIQNNGPGTITIDAAPDPSNGLVLPPGSVFEFSLAGLVSGTGADSLHVVSDQPNTDVRVLLVW